MSNLQILGLVVLFSSALAWNPFSIFQRGRHAGTEVINDQTPGSDLPIRMDVRYCEENPNDYLCRARAGDKTDYSVIAPIVEGKWKSVENVSECDILPRRRGYPKNVHDLRPDDFKVIMALGDS